eukprot:EG_transcript_6461
MIKREAANPFANPKSLPSVDDEEVSAWTTPTTEKGRAAAERNRGARENRVQVAVRIRPMTKADGGIAEGAIVADGHFGVKTTRVGEPPKEFVYDYVFDSGQEEVWDCIGKPMLADAYDGYNVTLFAYGQTGSGKTYSIMGEEGFPGLIPRFVSAMMGMAQDKLQADSTLSVKLMMEYIEIYNEKIRDLLERKKPGQVELSELALHETKDHRVFVEGVSVHTILTLERVNTLLAKGFAQRQTSETNMNEKSSRSHAVVIFRLAQTHDPPNPEARDVESTICIVDLAGSERQSKTGSSGDRFEEARRINLSLLTLGRALNSFSEGKGPPLRESKLTRLLSESFGGNSRTWMLACVSPSMYNYIETVSTLTYASSAKNIINHAKVNALQQKLELQQLRKQYAQLEELYHTEKEKSKQQQMELQERAKQIQTLREEVEALKAQLEGRPARPLEKGAPLFVGRAKLSLRNIIQQVSSYNTLPLITDNLENDGAALMVNTFPVVDKERGHIEYETVEEGLAALLGKRLDLVVHVISAKNLPQQYSSRVYCKYVFKYKERQVFQSDIKQDTCDPEFDFKKRFAWSDLTSEQADYLMSDNVLTFEVIGHPAGDSSTVVE